jgi:hypothetical protein
MAHLTSDGSHLRNRGACTALGQFPCELRVNIWVDAVKLKTDTVMLSASKQATLEWGYEQKGLMSNQLWDHHVKGKGTAWGTGISVVVIGSWIIAP